MQELTDAQPTKRKLAPAVFFTCSAAAIIVCAMLVHTTAFGTPTVTPPAAGSVSEVPSVTAAPDVPVSVPVAVVSPVVGFGAADSGAGVHLSSLAGKRIISISGSEVGTTLLSADGHLYQATGDGVTDVSSKAPKAVAIASGAYFTAALSASGVTAWGEGYDGNPAAIPTGLTGVTAIAAGDTQILALHSDGTVSTFGGLDAARIAVPAGLTGVSGIAAGSTNFGAIVGGRVVTWGTDAGAQPTAMAGVQIVSLVAGDRTFLALSSTGQAYAWGAPWTPNSTLPEAISSRTEIKQIASGRAHGLVLTKTGQVLAFGISTLGQATVPTDLAPATLIGAGSASSWTVASPATATK